MRMHAIVYPVIAPLSRFAWHTNCISMTRVTLESGAFKVVCEV
ncbi:hypothetical protein QE331_gp064 [Pseudomonas phage 20Sep416]|uniref:Uncharacterized protein n=2 Tax=Pakpunavirus TaxID=1921407 RepID=A0AAF0FIY7_9CAUD|nr:hypothetical protein QE331_gp064 [Pseudomonas phage 20Sep416]WFG37559.1 hypothetical protein 20Sep416_00064 [Pseudomonas phage 20Sep416]